MTTEQIIIPPDSEPRFRLLVPVSEYMIDAGIEELLVTAETIVRGSSGCLFLLGMVEIGPDGQTDSGENPTRVERLRETMTELTATLESESVAASLVTHEPSKILSAILEGVNRHGCDGVFMLRYRNRSLPDRLFTSDLANELMSEASCDVFIETVPFAPQSIERILLAVGGGPHSRFAAETTRSIAQATGAEISVIHVVSPNASSADRAEANRLLDAADEILSDVSALSTIVDADDVSEQILGLSGKYDLTVFGAPTASLLRRAVFGTVPEHITDQATKPILIVKHGTEDEPL